MRRIMLLMALFLITSCSQEVSMPSEFTQDAVYSSVAGTGSMLPMITPDSRVFYKPVTAMDDIDNNDVIYYKSNCPNSMLNYTIHRCIFKLEDGCITKGDNNPTVDENIVKLKDIKYKVVGIWYE